MPDRRLIVSDSADAAEDPGGTERMTLAALRNALRSGAYVRMLGRYRGVELRLYSLAAHGRLWPYAVLLPPLSRGETLMTDSDGETVRVKPALALRLVFRAISDRLAAGSLRRRIERSLSEVESAAGRRTHDPSKPALYLRTDFWFGIKSGGSIGHVAGVVNNLGHFGGAPVLVTTDHIPTVCADIETHVVRPGDRFRNLGELRVAAFREHLLPRVDELMAGRDPGLIYQRSSAFDFSGLSLAIRHSAPLVLEYNSSHVWNARNLGSPLRNEALAERIELANLNGADLVVVVSEALRDELTARGLDPERVLVNPNGVDTDAFSPAVDGGDVRRRLGLSGKTVIGFIGTFSRWHGAEVLADAFGRLLERHPDLRDDVRLLMVGDGATMPDVVESLRRHGVLGLAVLTGSVPQAEGAAHLAACDVLASPHVPNPDGTPFFGSPTKIFEYMAMGRGIVASRLGQIGEVLGDGRTALLVTPGDADALARALETLVRDPELRARLGAAAREDAVARHTWQEHTRRIIEALHSRDAG